LSNLKPFRVERLVEPGAARLSSPGGADLHVGRADDVKLTPTPGNANHKTDESGRVRLTRQDLAVEDDDAPRIEPLDPHYVLERKPTITRRRSHSRDDRDSYSSRPLGRRADLNHTAVQHNNLPRLESSRGNCPFKHERGDPEGSREPVPSPGATDGTPGPVVSASVSRGQLANPNSRAITSCLTRFITTARQ